MGIRNAGAVWTDPRYWYVHGKRGAIEQSGSVAISGGIESRVPHPFFEPPPRDGAANGLGDVDCHLSQMKIPVAAVVTGTIVRQRFVFKHFKANPRHASEIRRISDHVHSRVRNSAVC
jgi:hypothetical protein